MIRTCPPETVLADLLADRLPPEVEGGIEDHLTGCSRCRDRLDRLTGWGDGPEPPASCGDTSLPQRLVTTVAARLASVIPVDAIARSRTGSSALPTVRGYKLIAEVGRGGCGVVYRAVDRELARTVALKLLRDRAKPAAQERFRREAAALAALRHPNVVQIYGIGDEDGQPFLALEYVAGGSLARFTAGEPQEPMEAAALIEALARGVGAANQVGLIHRDLKPANILLEPRAGCAEPKSLADYVPKVTDFGVVKSLTADSNLTDTRDCLGTPSYMAPEQAGGGHDVDHRADVYALGAILYELLTGHPPFRAATPIDTLVQVAFDEPVPPSRMQPRLPRDVETICLKCLEKDPARRYANADALADDLARFREGRPIRARAIRWPARAWRWCRRSPRRAAVAALAASLLLFVAIAGPLVAQRERVLRQQADEQRERARRHLDLASRALDETIGGLSMNARLRAYGMDDVRADLLRQAVPYLEKFAAEDDDTPDIEVRQARAAIQLATVNVGDGRLDKAAEAYRRGLAMFERLAAGPNGAAHLRDLASAHFEFGRFLLAEGRDLPAAARHLREALRIADGIAPDDGGTTDERDLKANILSVLALPIAGAGTPEERRVLIERAVRIRERLAAENPDRPDFRRYATMTSYNLAVCLSQMGLKKEAADRLERALAEEQRLAGSTAASLDGPRLRSDMEGALGEILNDLGRAADGRRHVGEALRIAEAAARLFPADAGLADKTLLWYDSLANMQERAVGGSYATTLRRKAVTFSEQMVAAAPAVEAHRDGLMAAHLTLAEQLARRGQAEADEEFKRTANIGRKLPAIRNDPERAAHRAECFRRLATYDLEEDRADDALAWLEQALGLIRGDPRWADGPFRRDLETERAMALDQLGRTAEAAAARAQADRCHETPAPSRPSNPATGTRRQRTP
jgi:tetratricopeptide (TPR) repeat protein